MKQKTLIDDESAPEAGASAPAEAKPRRKPNPTVAAIKDILEILEPLDLERRRRVLACVLDELGVQVCRAVPVDPPNRLDMSAPAWKPQDGEKFEPRSSMSPERVLTKLVT